jgi:hypothetical protein
VFLILSAVSLVEEKQFLFKNEKNKIDFIVIIIKIIIMKKEKEKMKMHQKIKV